MRSQALSARLLAAGSMLLACTTLVLVGGPARGGPSSESGMEQAATLAEALGLESYIADARIAASRSTPDTDKAIAETQDVIAGLRDDLGTEENPAPGYAGMVAIAPKAAVDLWWKGHLPTSVETVIASYRERLKINVNRL